MNEHDYEKDCGEEVDVPPIVEKAQRIGKDAGYLALIGLIWTALGPMVGIDMLLQMAIGRLKELKEQQLNNLSWRKSLADSKGDSATAEGQPLDGSETGDGGEPEVPPDGIKGEGDGDQVPTPEEAEQLSTMTPPPATENTCTEIPAVAAEQLRAAPAKRSKGGEGDQRSKKSTGGK